MDYLKAFAISGSGMNVEKQRLDVTALNIANAHSTRGPDGAPFVPLKVISGARAADFQSALTAAQTRISGAEVVEIRAADVPLRLVYEPAHPDADAKGFVAYPGINPVNEMVTLISTMRAYEANLAAVQAARTMAMRALDMGGE